jgi:uncharacterized protein YdeI (YjbR/CyaY-like superfamily)
MEYKTIYIPTRAAWRKWLKENHLSQRGIWFTFYKKHTGKKSITYDDAVEEALCYGWIDSTIKKFDEERYLQKFTPRTNNNQWSAANIKRMKKLIQGKKMTRTGLAKISPAMLNQKIQPVQKTSVPSDMPQILVEAFKTNPKALAGFNNLAPSYRKIYIKWIMFAKKEETRLKRLNEALSLLETGKKLGLK